MTTLISIALLSAALLGEPQTPDRRAEAERLARSGAHGAALKQFQQLASENPDDFEARLWIARLHASMGHNERAVDVYRSILSAQPQNVDVLVGLGAALTTLGELRAAADALNRAEAIAADRPAMLAAQGHLHRLAGHQVLARAYYQRALALDASNVEVRAAYESLRAERAHRVEASYYLERFDDDAPDTHAGLLEVNARASDAVRVFAAGQHFRKFDLDENRGGGGIEWIARSDLRLRAGALFGTDTLVLPDLEASVDAEYSRRHVAWLGSVRYLDFDSSSSVIYSPGVRWTASDRLAITLRYYRSQTSFNDLTDDEGNNAFGVSATGRVGRRVWLTGGYASGYESLPIITTERASQLDADNLAAAVRFDPVPMTSLGAAYQHQWRDGTRVSTALLTLIQRF